MAYSFNKLWAVMTVSLATAANVVTAYSGQWTDGDSYNTSCPSPRPVCGSCGSWYFDAEALFWKAHEDGLGYALRNFSNPTADSTSVTASRIQNPHSNWDVGYRIGVGYDFNCDCWDVSAYWTHFQTKAKGHSTAPTTDGTLTSLWSSIDITGNANGLSTVDSHWKLRLDYADFVLGREFCISPCVTLRPFIGVRAAWIKQKYNIFEGARQTSGGEVVLINTSDINLRSEFDGAGLIAGLDSQWNVGCGFSVYGTASASILYGRKHSHSEDSAFFPSSTPSESVLERGILRDHRHGSTYAADAALGLRWKRCFCDDTVLFTIQLGWEQHLFFDQNRFEKVPVVTTFNGEHPQIQRSDLCVQGITLGAKIDF
jgi:hypothetical protein